jgi:hypothetical protein
MKKSFQLVSRRWRDMTSSYMYNRVEITDFRRVVLLVDALERRAQDDTIGQPSGMRIKIIRLACYISHNWTTIYAKYVSKLLSYCPNLDTFIIASSRPTERYPKFPLEILDALAKACSKSLRHFTIAGEGNERITLRELDGVLRQCSKLEFLGIFHLSFEDTGSENPLFTPPKLRCLYVTDSDSRPTTPGFRNPPPVISLYPSLTQLRVRSRRYKGGSDFFLQYGQNLTSLFWTRHLHWAENINAELENVLPSCPNLTSLGFDHRSQDPPRLLEPKSGAKITRVFMYGYLHRVFSNGRRMQRARETDFGLKSLVSLPSLRSVCLPDVTVNDLLDLARMDEDKRTHYHWAVSYIHNHSIILMDKYGHIIEPDVLKEQPVRPDESSQVGKYLPSLSTIFTNTSFCVDTGFRTECIGSCILGVQQNS